MKSLQIVVAVSAVALLASCSGDKYPEPKSLSSETGNDSQSPSASDERAESTPESDELRNSPAYQAAAAGDFDKGKAIVAAGEDTKEHLIMGIKYHDTHESFAQGLSEMQAGLNEAEYNSLKARAENGDPDAQAWMEKNGHSFKVLNDSVKEMNNNSTPPDSASGSNTGGQ